MAGWSVPAHGCGPRDAAGGVRFHGPRTGPSRGVPPSVRVVRLVDSARAASAARDVPAVTLVWIMERIAWLRVMVKDTWSVVTLPLAWRRLSARAAAASLVRDAAALARTNWVPVIHAQNSP